jgi:hypothetical protein
MENIAQEIFDKYVDSEDLMGAIKEALAYTGLVDKNKTPIKIGDRYTVGCSDFYTVYFKKGAVCGGRTFADSVPLVWDAEVDCDGDAILADSNTNWLTIV